MDDTEKIPSSTFGAPFDDADADLTLRSSDLVDFHVYKNAIFKASASLKNTVQDTSESPGLESTTSTVSARPILALPEPSRVLRTLLSLICHVPIDLPDSFQDMAAALAAARKYEMEASVSILSKLVRGGSDQPWSMGSVDPFKAYFISCRFGLKEEAMRAAHLTLPKDAKMERLVGSELLCVSGPELYALWRYRDDASNAVRACVKQFCTASQYQRLWMPDDSASLARCKDSARDQLPVWLRSHLLKAAEHPTCIDMATFYQAFSKHAWGTNCSWCQEIPPDKVQRVWTELEKIVIEAADKINFPFDSMGKDPGAQPNAPRTTPNPAFARPDADVILRSSDNVDFGVYKATLAMASPVFESMFSLPNPSGSQEATVQVCQMTEGSKTLNTLLSMIFPVNVIIPTTIEDVFSVRSAAQKFDMDSVLHLLRIILKSEDDLVTAKNAFPGLGSCFIMCNSKVTHRRASSG
ncbi:hypothetical protein OF83DRAFT_1084270 [Amylostereum chailletii]|nr:hypothetical protein OF83DRAFT_1084270 [Amylostereum chailletii]